MRTPNQRKWNVGRPEAWRLSRAANALEMKDAPPEGATVAAVAAEEDDRAAVAAAVTAVAGVADRAAVAAVLAAVAEEDDRATAPVVHAKAAVGLPGGRQILCTVSHEACH